MEDSDGREAREALSFERKPIEELESKTEPVARRTRFHADKVPKLSTTPTKGRRGSGRKRSATKPLEGEEEEEHVECAKCAQMRGQWVEYKKTRAFRSIHSVLKHWLLLLITMHRVWKPDAKLTLLNCQMCTCLHGMNLRG